MLRNFHMGCQDYGDAAEPLLPHGDALGIR